MFETDIKNYTLSSVIRVFYPLLIVNPIEKYTDKVNINDGNITVVPPTGCTISNITYQGGVEAGLDLDIFGFRVAGDLKVQDDEFKIRGNCDKIDTKYFKLSSAQNDSLGPNLDIEFGKTEDFKFALDAKANLVGIETAVQMNLNQKGLELNSTEHFYPFGLNVFAFDLYCLLSKGEKVMFD